MSPSEHWSAKYIGMPYVSGQFDCADLAKLVLLEVFDKRVEIPSDRTYVGKHGVTRARAQARQIQECMSALVTPAADPKDGDGVLLIGRGRARHIGVLCVVGDVFYVLHASGEFGQAVCHKTTDLERYGLQVEGYYRWI